MGVSLSGEKGVAGDGFNFINMGYNICNRVYSVYFRVVSCV